MNTYLIRLVTSRIEFYMQKKEFWSIKIASYYGCSVYVRLLYSMGHRRITNGTGEIESNMFCSNERSEEASVIFKRGFLGPFPHAEKAFIPFISKYFNWHAQEIGQFSSFLFNFSWSQIFVSTGQGNGALASDFHIKDTSRIKTLFNFHSDRLNLSHKESKEDATIYSRKSPTKNTHYSFFSIESIITATYIPRNCAPQIGTNEQTCDPIERHHDSLGKKNDLLRRE